MLCAPYRGVPLLKSTHSPAEHRFVQTFLRRVEVDIRFDLNLPLAFQHFRSLVENSAVQDLVQKEVDQANSHMPQVQQVRKFHLFTKELDHDDGEVTATMKVKRKSIYEKYAGVIEEIYA